MRTSLQCSSEHWNKLLREVVESLSLEMFTTHLETYNVGVAYRRESDLAGRLDSTMDRCPFQPLQFCDSVMHEWLRDPRERSIK